MKSCPACQNSYPNNFAVCPQDGTPLIEVSAWADGSVIRGKYRILCKVGQGGMGAVYKALHLAFDELRALKVISPELLSDELFVKRFKHEAVITRKLQHPNAVRVDDIDEAEDGRPFIVMEFIEGQSLKKLIQEAGPLPMPRVCDIIRQVARALEAAHRLGMIHRDIKPENIALIQTPEGEQAKVLDFGIAKVKEARLGSESSGMTMTGTGVVIGTPQYMSPEQAMGKRGDELDGRSDLYSLGVVMYQMLTGDLPFKADTTMEMLLAHVQKPPAPIRELHPELPIPEGIARLVMRLLEKDPKLRPASAKALIEEIDRAQQETAPLGATRVLRPTTVVLPEEVRAAQAAAAPPSSGAAGVAAKPEPAKPRVVIERGRAPQPPAVIAPPAGKSSQWGLLAGIAVLVIVIGGGGWYFLHRPSVPTTEPQITSPLPTGTTSPAAQGTTSGSTTSPAGQTKGPTQPAAQPEASPAASRSNAAGSASGSPRGTRAPGGAQPTQRSNPRLDVAAPGEPTPAKRGVDQQKVSSALALGDMYLRRGEYSAAIDEYQKGLNEDPSNPTLRQKIDEARKAKAAEERVLQ
jgi:serine/threonine-protein kinase